MAIRHVVTIHAGKVAEFAGAFTVLQAIAEQEGGCELETHMEAERTRNAAAIEALVALWAPGTSPTIERFED